MTLLKPFSVVLLLLIPLSGYAYEELSYADFFAKKENNDQYDALISSGSMLKIRNNMASICQKSNTDKPATKKQCECLSDKIQSASDKELMYASVISYKRFQAKVNALNTDNHVQLERIKQYAEQHPLIDELIQQQCNTP